jgi:hypothetical protein
MNSVLLQNHPFQFLSISPLIPSHIETEHLRTCLLGITAPILLASPVQTKATRSQALAPTTKATTTAIAITDLMLQIRTRITTRTRKRLPSISNASLLVIKLMDVSDGSYYYSNADGSKYHNDGHGGATYMPPEGGKK